MASELTEGELDRVVGLVDGALRSFPCPAPRIGEPEPAFTGRVFVPQLRVRLKTLGINGLTVAGDGLIRPTATYLLGHQFFPDLSVSYFERRLVAYEVKFLRARGRSNSISTALGQCLLYQLDRYPRVRALLVECGRTVPKEEQEHCARLFKRAGDRIDLIYRTTEKITE